MSVRIGICDDESFELKMIVNKIKALFTEKEFKAEIYDYTDSEKFINDPQLYNLDVIFLDIDMPSLNGIDIAQTIREVNDKIIIIFITRRDDLVFQSIKCSPFRFVRKSHLDDELEEAVDAIIYKMSADSFIVELPGAGGQLFIKTDDIICFTSVKHHVYMVTDKDRYLINSTMKDLEAHFFHNGFIRIHSSYLVNYRYIFSINKDGVVLDNGETLPISRHRVTEAKDRLHFYIRKW